MQTHCASCKKNSRNENSSVRGTKQNKLMLLSNGAIFDKKKSMFIKSKSTGKWEIH